jgi:hypothetical protein
MQNLERSVSLWGTEIYGKGNNIKMNITGIRRTFIIMIHVAQHGISR